MHWVFNKEPGKPRKSRVCNKTNNVIPKPPPYKRKERATGPYDTVPTDVLERTFTPDYRMCPIPRDCVL